MYCGRDNHIGVSQNKQLGKIGGLYQSFFFIIYFSVLKFNRACISIILTFNLVQLV